MGVHISFQELVFNSVGYISRNRIGWSCGNSFFKFLRKEHAVFHSRCTILYSHQQVTMVSISPYPCQDLLFPPLFLFLFFFLYFDISHPNGCIVVGGYAFEHLLLLILSSSRFHETLYPRSFVLSHFAFCPHHEYCQGNIICIINDDRKVP